MYKFEIFKDHKKIDSVKINKNRIFIGRNPDNDIVLDDISVSRNHCQVEHRFQQAQFVLKDLGSTNTTRINGMARKTHSLKNGDEIEIGSFTLIFKT